MNKVLEILDPVFANERDWPIARSGFIKINRLLKMVKELVKNDTENSTDDFFSVMDRLTGTIQDFSSDSVNYENITQILDLSYVIMQDGIKLTTKLLDRHQNQFELQVLSLYISKFVMYIYIYSTWHIYYMSFYHSILGLLISLMDSKTSFPTI